MVSMARSSVARARLRSMLGAESDMWLSDVSAIGLTSHSFRCAAIVKVESTSEFTDPFMCGIQCGPSQTRARSVVVGSGLLARACAPICEEFDGFFIHAAGVSNSGCADER